MMDQDTLSFVKFDPNKAYLTNELWLPKNQINVPSIQNALEFQPEDDEEWLILWREELHHLVVPREFYKYEDYPRLPFQVVDLTPQKYPKADIQSRVVLDLKDPEKTVQRDAFRDFDKASSGILNLSCGIGKSVISLHKIASTNTPALVICNTTNLIEQWIDRALECTSLSREEMGIIRGGSPESWDWQKPLVFATIQTLYQNVDTIPLALKHHFGIVIWDEIHHLAAYEFSKTATIFPGHRYGLTATATRPDGREVIYNYHIGSPFHVNLNQDLKPRIYFQKTPIQLDLSNPEVLAAVYDKRGMLNFSKTLSYLADNTERLDFLAEKLQEALSSNRRILAISWSKQLLRNLRERYFPDAGDCTGDIKNARKRLNELRDNHLVFGTMQIAKENLDKDTLDSLHVLTPFKDANTLQQTMGRIQRIKEGKPTPVMVIYDDHRIPSLHKLCNKLRRALSSWPEEMGGPLSYTNLRPFPAS